jgi:hypothetical protein
VGLPVVECILTVVHESSMLPFAIGAQEYAELALAESNAAASAAKVRAIEFGAAASSVPPLPPVEAVECGSSIVSSGYSASSLTAVRCHDLVLKVGGLSTSPDAERSSNPMAPSKYALLVKDIDVKIEQSRVLDFGTSGGRKLDERAKQFCERTVGLAKALPSYYIIRDLVCGLRLLCQIVWVCQCVSVCVGDIDSGLLCGVYLGCVCVCVSGVWCVGNSCVCECMYCIGLAHGDATT